MRPQKIRLLFIIFSLIMIAVAVWLMKEGLKRQVSVFQTPTDIVLQKTPLQEGQAVRLGGYVKKGTVKIEKDIISFIVTDHKHDLKIDYNGILPDLFREEQGVLIDGIYKNNQFIAHQVLAKHDENYKPPIE